jgi:inorganic pyrophosphatase
MYANVRKLKDLPSKLKDLPSKWMKELQDFFVNYHNLEGKKYQLLGCKGEDKAFSLIKEAKKSG